MAKKICPFCKEKIKANATICKHCKSGLPALPPKRWYQTWKGLLLIIFVFGIIGQAIKEQPATTSSASHNSSPSSTTNRISYANVKETIRDEKKALRDSCFGNFKEAIIQKKSGNIKLVVWQPWIQYVKQHFPPKFRSTLLSGSEKLSVSFDEIWISENNENLTETEKKKYKGQFDIIKLYWKEGKIQASTIEKFYIGNPLTGAKLSIPTHKITDIFDRKYILKTLSKS